MLTLAQVDAQETPSKRTQTPNCWDAIDRSALTSLIGKSRATGKAT